MRYEGRTAQDTAPKKKPGFLLPQENRRPLLFEQKSNKQGNAKNYEFTPFFNYFLNHLYYTYAKGFISEDKKTIIIQSAVLFAYKLLISVNNKTNIQDPFLADANVFLSRLEQGLEYFIFVSFSLKAPFFSRTWVTIVGQPHNSRRCHPGEGGKVATQKNPPPSRFGQQSVTIPEGLKEVFLP